MKLPGPRCLRSSPSKSVPLLVDGEQLTELSESAVEEVSNRGFGSVHFQGDVGSAQADDSREDDDFAIVIRELCERSIDASDFFRRSRCLAGSGEATIGGGELSDFFVGINARFDATGVAPFGSMEGVLVDELSQSRREEPCAKRSFAAVLKALGVFEDLAHDGLHDVRLSLGCTHERSSAQAHVGAQIGQVPDEQFINGGAIAALSSVYQLLEGDGVHSITARDARR